MIHITKASQRKIIDQGKFIIRMLPFGFDILNYNDKGLFKSRYIKRRSSRNAPARTVRLKQINRIYLHRQAHYAFWHPHKANKKCVKSLPLHSDKKFPFPFFIFFSQHAPRKQRTTKKATATNSGFAKVAVQFPKESFVYIWKFVFQKSLVQGCRHLRKWAAER